MLVRVVTPHYVAGVVLVNGVVVTAAPILRWTLGSTFAELTRYLSARRLQWDVVCV